MPYYLYSLILMHGLVSARSPIQPIVTGTSVYRGWLRYHPFAIFFAARLGSPLREHHVYCSSDVGFLLSCFLSLCAGVSPMLCIGWLERFQPPAFRLETPAAFGFARRSGYSVDGAGSPLSLATQRLLSRP
jgi:hypothetical protein